MSNFILSFFITDIISLFLFKSQLSAGLLATKLCSKKIYYKKEEIKLFTDEFDRDL